MKYTIKGGPHVGVDGVIYRVGAFYTPTRTERKAFPEKFELVDDGMEAEPPAGPSGVLIHRISEAAIFVNSTHAGVVMKAIADKRFTAEECLAAELAGQARPVLLANLEAVIEGRIEAHPDNVKTLEELADLMPVDDSDQKFDITKKTIAQVIELVEAGEVAADVALAMERGRERPRIGLLNKLEALLE